MPRRYALPFIPTIRRTCSSGLAGYVEVLPEIVLFGRELHSGELVSIIIRPFHSLLGKTSFSPRRAYKLPLFNECVGCVLSVCAYSTISHLKAPP